MKTTIGWVMRNKVGLFIAAVGLSGLILTMVASGCQTLEDYIRFRVPPEIQRVIHSDSLMPLSEQAAVVNAWTAYVETNSASLDANIRRAFGTLYLVQGLMQVGLEGVKGSGGFPFGGVALALLFGSGGLMMERPGQGKRTAVEKEASHKHGRKIVMDVLSLVGGSRRRTGGSPGTGEPEA